MKKIIAVLTAALVLLLSAVPAFAAVTIGTIPLSESLLGKAGCISVEGGMEYVQTFKASTLSAADRAVYDAFVALPDDRKLMVGRANPVEVYLIVTSSSTSFITGSAVMDMVSALSFKPSADGDLVVSSNAFSFTGKGIKFFPGDYLIMGSSFAQKFVDGSAPLPLSDFLKHYQTWDEGIGYRDDIGNGTPSEPEPPTSSSEPEPPAPPYVPGAPPPTASGSSPYVPYDVSVWDDFVAYIRTSSGSATNIIFLVLGPIAAVSLIVSLFKHYTSGGKKGGEGGTAI